MVGRFVAVLFGPPGAGKTTLAQASGLTVYDRDDPQWGQNETRFRAALVALGKDPNARAVVIRAGTTEAARTNHRRMVQATHAWMVWVDMGTAHHRVKVRARDPKDHRNVVAWYGAYDHGMDVPMWTGSWQDAIAEQPHGTIPMRQIRTVRPGPRQRGYDRRHDLERARWVRRVDAGGVDCARCHQPIEPGRPWDLGHTDDRTGWTGPEHVVCNRRAGGRNGNLVLRAMQGRGGVRASRDW